MVNLKRSGVYLRRAAAVLVACAFMSSESAEYSAQAEQIEFVKEWEAASGLTGKINFTQYNQQLATYKGFMYVVVVDTALRPRIVKINEKTKAVQVKYLHPDPNYKVRDDGHSKFSLGIDNKGFIHVAGDMHHHPHANTDHIKIDALRKSRCLYWVSNNPEDITSFTFVGNDSSRVLPGYGFSYLQFIPDRNGVLFAVSRQWERSGDGSWVAGKIGLGAARYNSDTRKWQALGGTTPLVSNFPKQKLIFWEDNGSGGTAYQGLMVGFEVDNANRIHLSATINNDNSGLNYCDGKLNSTSSHTDVVYARSDDSGNTWKRASGATISALPIRVSTADALFKTRWLTGEASVSILKGMPIVFYRKIYNVTTPSCQTQSNSLWSMYKGAWTVAVAPPISGRRLMAVVDRRNVMTIVNTENGYFYRLRDLAIPGVKVGTPAKMYYADRTYLAATGELRFFAQRGANAAIYTVRVSGD
ncbi:MAG TPA: hypothetical protein DDZ80_28465 [Cyanobacteria bacterium UBA8803]|nr:hypothetical protein [Cyanobacteria bacterium UBA9273]HBL62192.1 hypothetical protein [Cyanobacteria bacterium UBA8803]